jgi:hypothetical protein
MKRDGHSVDLLNPGTLLRRGWVLDRVRSRSGYRSSRNGIARGLDRELAGRRYDAVWVGGGRELGASAVDRLHRYAPMVINYNNDDPWGGRDGRLWDSYLQAVPEYDLVVVLRRSNVAEARASGARRVLRVWMSFDEVVHRAQSMTAQEESDLESDIAFVGTWRLERGPVLASLVARGLDIAIWGDRWNRAPEWETLAPHWRGRFLVDANYTKALQSTKVAVGLLCKGNRDLHTRRSVEVPALGTVLCAERTAEHQQLFGESGAALWNTIAECADHCCELLGDDAIRVGTAKRGAELVRGFQLSNQPMTEAVLAAAGGRYTLDEWPPALAVPVA